jgi:hypothetical protein
MQAIEVRGRSIERGPKGFIVNFGDWDEAFARAVAAEEGLELRDCHWKAIRFIRRFFEQFEGTGKFCHPGDFSILRPVTGTSLCCSSRKAKMRCPLCAGTLGFSRCPAAVAGATGLSPNGLLGSHERALRPW